MNRHGKLVGLAAAVVLLTAGAGCVSQVEYDNLQTAYRRGQEQIVDLQGQLQQERRLTEELQKAMKTPSGDPTLQGKLAQALADKETLEKKLAELEDRFRKMGMTGVALLPAEVDRALKALADANPGLIVYDAKRGMVKFASDLTFELGSTEVKPAAQAALAKLAAIIRGPEAAGLEALVVGHTDNVRIARPDTLARHPTNWHLSVHRAISVKDVLQKAGVAPTQMSVGGYGEYRPLVPNGPRGAEANRRVEIFLVRSTASGIDPGAPVDAGTGTGTGTTGTTPPPVKGLTPPKENPAEFK